MVRLGFIRDNAEIIETEERGNVTVLRIQAIGINEKAALRGAMKEASSIIPIPQQDVLNISEIRSRGVNDVFLISISDVKD